MGNGAGFAFGIIVMSIINLVLIVPSWEREVEKAQTQLCKVLDAKFEDDMCVKDNQILYRFK